MVYHFAPDDGLRLVQHPGVAATAFTGSRRTGLALKAAAEQAGKLIYLEMSSLNPVFILPGALQERLAQVSQELFASCTLGTGQYCTNPGLVIVPAGELGETFVTETAALFRGAPPGTMLGETLPTGLAASLATLQHAGALVVVGGQPGPGPGYSFQNTLQRVSGREFLANRAALQTEAFGPASLVVLATGEAELLEIVQSLEGNLTGSIYSDTAGADDALYARLEPILRPKVGRLLNDKMPTGVAVSPAMNHGGPFPATGHPGFTAVGLPAAMLRFAALHSYDNVREHRLPPELQEINPTGSMWRRIDGEWTRADVAPTR
jgi:alpha-ketoglutaric semialdehyde dehydrogenase